MISAADISMDPAATTATTDAIPTQGKDICSATKGTKRQHAEAEGEDGGSVSFRVSQGKTTHDITMPLSSSVEQLKARVEELTGVHANMQKLLYKGQLKNESTLKQAGVLDGVKILLMASKVEDIVKLAAAASTAPVIAAPMVVPKVPLSERPEHRKILDKGKPDDLEPGLFGRKLPLPAEGLRRMLTSRGDKCRLTFKLELDELHINTNERTQKVQMGAIKAVTSEPIKDHEEYHILILRLGPTEKSNVFFYWVPCQYVDSAKTAILGLGAWF